jgi:hypothetical protein
MSLRARLAIPTFGLIILLAAGLAPARGGLVASVSVVVTPEAGGISLYDYTVAVGAASTSAVSEFDLNLTSESFSGINTPLGAPLSSITMPTGFINLYTLGDPTISFYSTDPSTDIAPGTSALFSFLSTSSPVAMQPYRLSTLDGSGSPPVLGSVLGPTLVPEPSALLLLGLGALGGIGGLARARRRRRVG